MKAENRKTIINHFGFNEQEVSKFFVRSEGVDMIAHYNKFCEVFGEKANKLFDYCDTFMGKQYGPGEMVAYFIFDDILLGGGSSTCDLLKEDGTDFAEVKSVAPIMKRPGFYHDFKFGTEGHGAVAEFQSKLMKFIKLYDILAGEDLSSSIKASEISASLIDKLESFGDINSLSLSKFAEDGFDIKIKNGHMYFFNSYIGDAKDSVAIETMRRFYQKEIALPIVVDKSISSVKQMKDDLVANIVNGKIGQKPFFFVDNKNKRAIQFVPKLCNQNLFFQRISSNTGKWIVKLGN